jgi:hypothetical protein
LKRFALQDHSLTGFTIRLPRIVEAPKEGAVPSRPIHPSRPPGGEHEASAAWPRFAAVHESGCGGSYIDVFWTLMLISVAAVPLALVLRTIKLGTGAPAAH